MLIMVIIYAVFNYILKLYLLNMPHYTMLMHALC